jgi:hypothetical protein
MAKLYKRNKLNTIIALADKNGFTKQDICRLMGISRPTLEDWIANCGIIRHKDMCQLAGLFGVHIVDFVWMLERNKVRITKEDRSLINSILSLGDKNELPTD